VNKQRQDSWSYENDNVLAETVLNHIRIGSTQLNAFDEAAELLLRTSAACAFRWNAEVRKRYEYEFKKAKAQRLKNKARHVGKNSIATTTSTEQIDNLVIASNVNDQEFDQRNYETNYLDQIINLVQNQKTQLANTAKQIKILKEQLSVKDTEIRHLRRQLEEPKTEPNELTVIEDYRTLLQILQRARQLGAINDVERPDQTS
jgi:prespore-specific regulator